MKTNASKEELQQFRKLTRLSQSQFAKELGVSVDTVRKWEQGKAQPSPLAWEKLQRIVAKYKPRGNK